MSQMTLAELIDDYLEHPEKIKRSSSYERDKQALMNLLSILNANRSIESLTIRDFQRYQVERCKSVKPATVNIEIRVLRTMFNRAVKEGLFDMSPLDGLGDLTTGECKPPRFLSIGELNLYFHETMIIDEHLFLLSAVSVYSGALLAEAQALQWSDMRGDGLHVTNPASGLTRVIPLHARLSELIQQYGDRDSEFICGIVSGWDRAKVSTYARRAFKKADVRNASFQTLRHTFASHLVKNGASISTVAKLLGYADERMTRKYLYLHTEDPIEQIHTLNFDDF